MASVDVLKHEYSVHGESYNGYMLTPLGILETQLLESALGDCTGLTILDVGGGTGLRARQALDHGASLVDCVDLSPGMLSIGKAIEVPPEHRNRIRWIEADCSKSLDDVPLQAPGTYDIVMANWLFEHATSVTNLEGMWRNIAHYLKPGGRFVGVRLGDPHAPDLVNGKYGLTIKGLEEIPGGFRFRYRLDTDPPLEIEATSMKTSYSGSTEMHEKFGFCDVETEPYSSTEVVQQDPEFWQLFLDNPSMVVVKAKKKAV